MKIEIDTNGRVAEVVAVDAAVTEMLRKDRNVMGDAGCGSNGDCGCQGGGGDIELL